MTSPYEDALWKALVDAHGEALAGGRLPPPSRRHRPWAAAGGTALVAVAATGGVLVYSAVSNTTPAYAVSRTSDGAVAIVLRRLDGIGGLNARLRSMHVQARAVLVADDCAPSPTLVHASLRAHGHVKWMVRGRTVVRPASVGARRMRILLVRQSKEGRLALGAVTGRSVRAVPVCVNQVRVAVRAEALHGRALHGQLLLPPGWVVVRGTPPPGVLERCGPHPSGGGGGGGGTSTAGSTGTATAGSTGTATAGSTGTATAGSTGTATAGSTGTATVISGTTGPVAGSQLPRLSRGQVMQCVVRATGARTPMTGAGTATSTGPHPDSAADDNRSVT
jgi:hypothetical protein